MAEVIAELGTLTWAYVISQSLDLTGNIVGEINTEYNAAGSFQLDLPPVADIPSGSAIKVVQSTGETLVYDKVSEYGLDDEEETEATYTVLANTTIGFILTLVYGRKRWYRMPANTFPSSGGGEIPEDVMRYLP